MENRLEDHSQKDYTLCFPPGKPLAGHFLNCLKEILVYEPKVQYAYEYRLPGRERESVCLFMESMPEPKRLSKPAAAFMGWKIQRFMKEDTWEIYRMEDKQDIPYELRLYFAGQFLEGITPLKRTRLGIIEGRALKRTDLIALLRRCYHRFNHLTVFSREPKAYQEFAEDAWEQYGLAVTVTGAYGELEFCDYVLDCTDSSCRQDGTFGKGAHIFSVYKDRKKIRRLRKSGIYLTWDSCFDILDRVFHNKV